MDNVEYNESFTKFSMKISLFASLLSLIFILYDLVVTKNNDITIWLILLISNVILTIGNYKVYKKNKKD